MTKRVTVSRPYNAWTMSDAEFRSFIVSALRNASRFWKPKNLALARARISKGVYKCELCWAIGPPTLPAPPWKKRKIKNILADHISPIVPVTWFTTYDEWIKRCFVEAEHFQAICHNCHSAKTKEENKARRLSTK